MPEAAPRDSGDLRRQPPSPDQFRELGDLIEALTPDEKETRRRAAAGSETPGMSIYVVYDEHNVQRTVAVASYKVVRAKDDKNRIGFVNDMTDFATPALYYLEKGPGAAAMKLRMEEFGPPAPDGRPVLARVEEALVAIEGATAATALGFDTANAAEAQDLIDLLTRVQSHGHPLE